LLAIYYKLQLKPEAKRLLCRLTKVVKNQYTLICTAGPIKRSYNTSQLNKVLSPDESFILLKFVSWKKAKLTFLKAVAKTNNCGSIAAAQKANRLANKVSVDQDTSSSDNSDSDLDPDNYSNNDQELADRQLLDLQLSSRPIRLRKHTQTAIDTEDEPIIPQVSRRKRQKKTA
jgi:hypothetical protein